jgi:cell division protein ZapA
MSATGAEPVSIQLLDKEYLIACPPDARAELDSAATVLNTQLLQIRASTKGVTTERALIMAALTMANDLTKLKTQHEHSRSETSARVKQMREKVERALSTSPGLQLDL